ncbi:MULTISPECIES: septum formation family protein [Pseudofrankia]|uniref:septum formation family protein n=1 Tax=Pseudofrankia TaxID=2994363 RepID=UPI000234C5D8|nr:MULTISPECIES: septum formation family protein [Pseudofrankia]OHV35225.1 hypothetical protein BCD49_04475 [Pseudofrankia sp. EUN1h]
MPAAGAGGPAGWRTPPAPPGRPPRRWSDRKVGAVVFFAVVGLFLAAAGVTAVAVHAAGDDGEPVAAAPSGPPLTPASPTFSDLPTAVGLAFQRGHCYYWPGPDDVPCTTPHHFESTSDTPVRLSRIDYPDGAAYPSPTEWDTIDGKYCGPQAVEYLGYELDPFGRFRVQSIRPSEDMWNGGRRFLRCGLHTFVPVLERLGVQENEAVTGSAKGADQSWIYPIGTCLTSRPQSLFVADCAGPHEYLTIGNIRLPETAGGGPPSSAELNDMASPPCVFAARVALGQSFQLSPTETIGFQAIRPESWRAGSRLITCVLSYVTASGEPRSETGEQHHPAGGPRGARWPRAAGPAGTVPPRPVLAALLAPESESEQNYRK